VDRVARPHLHDVAAAITSNQASPVNVSAGAFTVGCCFIISNGLLLADARRQPGQSWPGPPSWLAALWLAAQ
jgi:hypothetical protein